MATLSMLTSLWTVETQKNASVEENPDFQNRKSSETKNLIDQ